MTDIASVSSIHLDGPSVEHDTCADLPVVRPIGAFDLATVDMLRSSLLAAVTEQPRILLDMSRVTFVDSSVLGVLVLANKRTRAEGGWLRLTGVPASTQRVLQVTALDQVLAIYPDLTSATAGRTPDGELVEDAVG